MTALPSDLAAPAGDGLAGALDPASKALRRADLGPLNAEAQAGTVFATLDGAPVAVVPLEFYRQLVAAAVAAAALRSRRPAAPSEPALGLSTIERDPEVTDFIRSQFRGGITVAQIRDACLTRFGEERTPSHQRIQRFRSAHRDRAR